YNDKFVELDIKNNLFVCEDITSYLLSKGFGISINVQNIVLQLKSDTEVHSKLVDQRLRFPVCVRNDCAHLQRSTQQHGSFKTYHINILRLADSQIGRAHV